MDAVWIIRRADMSDMRTYVIGYIVPVTTISDMVGAKLPVNRRSIRVFAGTLTSCRMKDVVDMFTSCKTRGEQGC